jgi:glutaredoxin-related protein
MTVSHPKLVYKHGDDIYFVSKIDVIVKNESQQPFIPQIYLNGVYITGGTVNAIQDGNPLQDVYTFTALSMDRYDKIVTRR